MRMDMATKRRIELPNLFCFADGRQVRNIKDWHARRQELLKLILDIEYGQLPPAPSSTRGVKLHSRSLSIKKGARQITYRLGIDGNRLFEFPLILLIPHGKGPFRVVITGDLGWGKVSNDIALSVLKHKCILAQFDRTRIVPDDPKTALESGLRRVYPKGAYGALAAWAWGFHRCVDFLVTLPFVDKRCIAVTGHSRGGKAALLAGATDVRIALTSANDSGCGGAGCFRWPGPGCEKVADILRGFPYWFSPRLKAFIGREDSLPFDQHSLKALIAPRALLSTEALGDLWANPSGTWQSYLAAREAYRFLRAEDRIGIWYRKGGHMHGAADWSALLDFMDWQFRGRKPRHGFNTSPFRNLPRAFSWSAPHPKYIKNRIKN